MDVTVVVATYGDGSWCDLADQRAIPSAEALDVPVIHCHGIDLADARNGGLSDVQTEWVCFLDADDELEYRYFERMAAGSADLRAPSVRYVNNDREAIPRLPRVAGHGHQCTADCLDEGNWLVIGTVAPTALVQSVGGFRDLPMYEDWDLWVRCWKAGATLEAIPKAIYRAHVRQDSRNRAPDRDAKLAAHRAIAEANGLPVPA